MVDGQLCKGSDDGTIMNDDTRQRWRNNERHQSPLARICGQYTLGQRPQHNDDDTHICEVVLHL